MNNISIVTAFYDIGRGSWSPQNGHPSYLHRTTNTYIERFSYLTRLSNDITVFTSEDLVDKIRSACDKNSTVNIVAFDVMQQFASMRDLIKNTQQSATFKSKIESKQIINPEYWNSDYVLVTNLKPYFVNKAIRLNKVKHNLVSWVDFGYCRKESQIPASRIWTYEYSSNKIHILAYKNYDGKNIEKVVATNDVYIPGALIIAAQPLWPKMVELMQSSFDKLLQKNLVDDDQGLLLYSYIQQPDIFQLHAVPDHQRGYDPLIFFNAYNDSCK